MNSKSLLKVAGIALVVHGVIELLGLFSLFTGEPPNFIFQEIKANWQQAVILGVIAGTVRIVAAVGIFRIMRWGGGRKNRAVVQVNINAGQIETPHLARFSGLLVSPLCRTGQCGHHASSYSR